jgi:Uma2 family endonuclease
VDGIAVKIDPKTTFEPDALVVCGERVPGNEAITSRPTIVVEVLAPSTGYRDLGPKLDGYFKLPTIQHYLVVDPEERRIVRHRRSAGEALETRLFSEGAIRLDPPGLEITAEEIFAGLTRDDDAP